MESGNTLFRLLLLIWILCAPGLLCSCGGGGGDSLPVETPKTWTVMVYMAADNSLAGAALADLAEIRKATGSTYVTVLVQLDLKGDQARRYRIANGETTEISALGQINSASAAAVTDFLTWGKQAAPADRSVLILWDHGSGWDRQDGLAKSTAKQVFAMLSDDGSSAPLLANVTIRSAIEQSGITLDILGFDGCNMGTIEALYEFRTLAPILISSQELEPEAGWDYTSILSSLASQPGQSTETFANGVVATYRTLAELVPSSYEHAATLAAIRSSRLEQLAVEADRVARVYLARLADPLQKTQALNDLATARKNVQAIDLYAQPYQYVDLTDFLPRLDPATIISRLMTDALIAEYHGKDRPGAHGLSIVFYQLPEAKTYNVFDPNYRNYDPATGTGNSSSFITRFNWDELVADYDKFR